MDLARLVVFQCISTLGAIKEPLPSALSVFKMCVLHLLLNPYIHPEKILLIDYVIEIISSKVLR